MEKRKSDRIQPLVIRAKVVYQESKKPGYLTNLSEAGAFLATEDAIPIGDKVALNITLPWQIGEISVEGTVEWTNFDSQESTPDHPAGVGLSFGDLPPAAQEKIGAFIQRFHELVAQLEDLPAQ
jgi:Tfp pilus assembly protein PilZ